MQVNPHQQDTKDLSTKARFKNDFEIEANDANNLIYK